MNSYYVIEEIMGLERRGLAHQFFNNILVKNINFIWVCAVDEICSPPSRQFVLVRHMLKHKMSVTYRVVRGDKVSGWWCDRVERVLALDWRHAETVYRHAVGLMGRHEPVLLVAGGRLGRGRLAQPLAAAHHAQHLLPECVIPEHVHERVERGRGQSARVHHLVRKLDDWHVHEQRRPAEQERGKHHHGRFHGPALLPEQQRRENGVRVAPRHVRFDAHAVLPSPQTVPASTQTREFSTSPSCVISLFFNNNKNNNNNGSAYVARYNNVEKSLKKKNALHCIWLSDFNIFFIPFRMTLHYWTRKLSHFPSLFNLHQSRTSPI